MRFLTIGKNVLLITIVQITKIAGMKVTAMKKKRKHRRKMQNQDSKLS